MASKVCELALALIKIGRESDTPLHNMAARNLGGDYKPVAFDAG
ncbi:hypothetical protein [Starkeya sp. ORNL1]|nr:hypothetical protein [Starkeya sp. ORNL1]